jgi:outer membrane protein TolC
LAAAEARLRQIRERERFLRDQVAAGIRDAASAVQTAFERATLAGEEISVARELEEAERARFQLGDGSLFLVNLREMTTADTRNRHLAALSDYLRARAQYEFAIGMDPSRRGPA